MLLARRLRVAAGLTATLLLAGLGGSALASPTDQSVAYQLSPAHDGHMTDAGLDAPLTQQWSVTLPGAISYPLIVNGMVFVTAADGKLYGLSQATGATVWSRDLDGGSRSGLTYDRGHVFATSTGGDLTAFDAATGTVAWTKHLGSEYFVTAAPTAAAGLVYAGADSHQMLYALRGRDGRLMWTRPVLSGDESSPAVDDDAVYAAYSCEQAHAFDRVTGDVRWHHAGACSGGGGRTPAVADNKVFARAAGVGDNLVLSAATGAELGTFSAGPAPAVADGVAYMLSDTTLSAVADSGLGATAWTFTGDGHLSTAPLVVGDVVIVGSTSGMLYALDAAAGTTLWSGDVGTAIPAPTEYGADRPLTGLGAANGTLVVPAGDKLVAYRTAGAITAVPSNDAPPSIDGVAQVRQILAADVGIWTGLPGSYAYQWRLCDAAGASCTDADRETDASFRPAGAHVGSTVRVRVVATNANGSSTAVTSAASAVVLASPPVNQVAPAIVGDAREGQTLAGSAGTWEGSPSGYAYQWRRCGGTPVDCADIGGETTLSHVVTQADIGSRLVLSVVATNAGGVSDPAESPSTAVVVPVVPVKQSPPTINGTPSPGQFLIAGAGVWSSEPTSYSIRWRRCNASGPLQPGSTDRAGGLAEIGAGRLSGGLAARESCG
jgi:outer membrane protein assembly factor BamB